MMTDGENVKQRIADVIRKFKRKVDYVDVRMGEGHGTMVNIRHKEIEDVSKPRSYGGSVRALFKGGWGFVAFTQVGELERAAEKAAGYAKLVGSGKSILAEAPVVIDKVEADEKDKDFLKIALAEKVRLLKHYDNLAWSGDKKISNVEVFYSDSQSRKLFVSSEGSVIEQEKTLVYSLLKVTARNSDTIQNYHINLTDTNFSGLMNKDDRVKEAVRLTCDLVEAAPAKSKTCHVILDPLLAGVFAHEAFGHLSEADNVYENPQLAKVMTLGKRFGSPLLTIYDDPSQAGYRGSYKYDDDGVKSAKSVLLDKGVLTGRLHSRETAGKLGEKVNGHARAAGVRAMPIVRMGITRIEAGDLELREMIQGIKDGLYCVNWQAGNTDHERFTFTAGYGIEIKNGKLGRIVRDVKLTGNLFQTLLKVEGVGKEVVVQGGTCGKMGQYIPENSGAPQVRLSEVTVIGI